MAWKFKLTILPFLGIVSPIRPDGPPKSTQKTSLAWLRRTLLQTFARPSPLPPLVCTSLHLGNPPPPLRVNVVSERPLS